MTRRNPVNNAMAESLLRRVVSESPDKETALALLRSGAFLARRVRPHSWSAFEEHDHDHPDPTPDPAEVEPEPTPSPRWVPEAVDRLARDVERGRIDAEHAMHALGHRVSDRMAHPGKVVGAFGAAAYAAAQLHVISRAILQAGQDVVRGVKVARPSVDTLGETEQLFIDTAERVHRVEEAVPTIDEIPGYEAVREVADTVVGFGGLGAGVAGAVGARELWIRLLVQQDAYFQSKADELTSAVEDAGFRTLSAEQLVWACHQTPWYARRLGDQLQKDIATRDLGSLGDDFEL